MRITQTPFVSLKNGKPGFRARSNRGSCRWHRITGKLTDWIADEDGTTAVEYAVMVGMIAVFVVVSVNLMTQAAEENFTATADAIAGV